MNEEYDFGDGVFTDDKSIDTLRESAKALGINPDLVAPEGNEDGEKQYRYFSKKNCKHCFGRGAIDVCISPSKEKVFQRNEGVPGRISKRKISSTKKLRKRKRQRPGPTMPQGKTILSVSIGNELGEQWNTRHSEPVRYKKDNMSKSFCSCVRAIEI